MKLVPTDESRRKRMRQWWYRATMGGDVEVTEPTLNDPHSLIVTGQVGSTIDLAWEWDGTAAGHVFDIYMGIAPDEEVLHESISTSLTQYTFFGTENSRTYYFKVKARREDPAAESGFSNEVFEITDFATPILTTTGDDQVLYVLSLEIIEDNVEYTGVKVYAQDLVNGFNGGNPFVLSDRTGNIDLTFDVSYADLVVLDEWTFDIWVTILRGAPEEESPISNVIRREH